MITEINLTPGGIYQTVLADDPVRVLAFDGVEVFYDVMDEWSFTTNLKRQGTYYRALPARFSKDAKFIRQQNLTADEFSVIRPDLPFVLCRNNKFSWTDRTFETLNDYKNYAHQFGIKSSDEIVLPVPSISLEPFGAKGTITALKSTPVTSIDSRGFTEIELLWLGNNIQAAHARHIVEKGVGIYRSGHKKKAPSYYIFGCLSRSGR